MRKYPQDILENFIFFSFPTSNTSKKNIEKNFIDFIEGKEKKTSQQFPRVKEVRNLLFMEIKTNTKSGKFI